jgi:hypothetical protein
MRRPTLRALLPLLLVTSLLSVGASPNVGDGPANLRQTIHGDVLASLDNGTALVLVGATCDDDGAWLQAKAQDQLGWISAALVSFGDGAAGQALSTGTVELRATPFGEVRLVLAPGQSFSAVDVTCDQGKAWLKVLVNGQEGWLLSDLVSLGGAVPAEPDASATPAASASPTAQPAVAPYLAASPEYGMGVFLWGRSDAPAVLGRVHDLNFTWQKSLITWRDIEGKAKGQYDWSGSDALLKASKAAGVKVLARVDFQPAWARKDGANNGPPDNYQDYADFLKALVTRYKSGSQYGHLDAIEVWNEPNLAREWGGQPVNDRQAGDYVRLLTAAYSAIKAADPTVTVVTAGLSPTGWNDDTARPDDQYLQWLYDAGLKGHYDVLGAHAPGYKAPPEVSPEEAAANPDWGGDRSFTFRRVEDLRAIMQKNGDGAKQVWVTEFGWTSDTVHPAYAWHRVTEDQKADYLVRAFEWARGHWAPWIGPMMVWNMPDPAWGPQDEMYWWSISNPDGSPRPAFLALKAARQNGTLP